MSSLSTAHGLDVGVVHANVLHAVFLLVAARQLVLFDATSHIVVGMGAHHETILCLTVHRLRVYIIMFLFVLHQPTLVLELLEVLCRFFIDARVVLASAYREVNLRLDDVIQTLLVVASLGTCLLTIEHVVGATLYLLHQFLRRTDSFKWFYDCHGFSFYCDVSILRYCDVSTWGVTDWP